ncbi:hypothetical protein V6O07_09100, partial [Arthrospira platensis SPKY2]
TNDNNFEILPPESDKPNSSILHGFPIASTTQQTSNLPHRIYVTKGETYSVGVDYRDINWIKSRFILMARIFPDANTGNSNANSLQEERILSTKATPEFTRYSMTFEVKADGYMDILP